MGHGDGHRFGAQAVHHAVFGALPFHRRGTQLGQQLRIRLTQRQVGANGLGPAWVAKDAGLCILHHPGIDERAATQAVGHQHLHVGAETKVEQRTAVAFGLAGPGRAEAHAAPDVSESRRKHARQVFMPPFEHADPKTPLRNFQRCHGAAIATADHDGVELPVCLGPRHQGRQRLRQPAHGTRRFFLFAQTLKSGLCGRWTHAVSPPWPVSTVLRKAVCAAGASRLRAPRAGAQAPCRR